MNIFNEIQEINIIGQAVNTLKSLIAIKIQLLNSPKIVDYLLRLLENANLNDKIIEV
jgi:hypothetical protein